MDSLIACSRCGTKHQVIYEDSRCWRCHDEVENRPAAAGRVEHHCCIADALLEFNERMPPGTKLLREEINAFFGTWHVHRDEKGRNKP